MTAFGGSRTSRTSASSRPGTARTAIGGTPIGNSPTPVDSPTCSPRTACGTGDHAPRSPRAARPSTSSSPAGRFPESWPCTTRQIRSSRSRGTRPPANGPSSPRSTALTARSSGSSASTTTRTHARPTGGRSNVVASSRRAHRSRTPAGTR